MQPHARIAKMKDGRAHLGYKDQHAVDLDTGAIVAVTDSRPTRATAKWKGKEIQKKRVYANRRRVPGAVKNDESLSPLGDT